MIRFEILLPLYYNDGTPIEREKFLTTDDELINLFGATSTDTVVVQGKWIYQGTLYHDQLIRIRIDAEDTPDNWSKMREVKNGLKRRFNQEELWVTAHKIDLI
jgi:hypothetical protein